MLIRQHGCLHARQCPFRAPKLLFYFCHLTKFVSMYYCDAILYKCIYYYKMAYLLIILTLEILVTKPISSRLLSTLRRRPVLNMISSQRVHNALAAQLHVTRRRNLTNNHQQKAVLSFDDLCVYNQISFVLLINIIKICDDREQSLDLLRPLTRVDSLLPRVNVFSTTIIIIILIIFFQFPFHVSCHSQRLALSVSSHL